MISTATMVKQILADEKELVRIAETGSIPPLSFIMAARQVPGYDPQKATGIENQWFTDGFPCVEEPVG